MPGPKRPYIFKAETELDKQKWVKTLRAAVNEIKAAACLMPDKVLKEENPMFGTDDYYCILMSKIINVFSI